MSARLHVGDIVRAGPVIAVLTIERAADAVPLAGALLAGGITVLEVTLRTAAAAEAIRAIAAEVPEAIVGAGTVLNPKDFQQAEAAGSRFIVSPGLTEPLLQAAAGSHLPFLPGVSTVSEVMRGVDAGLNEFKFFPAEAAGGPAFLKALHGPLPHCRFCPTGGVTAETARAWLELPNVTCVGGGWVAPARSILAGNWEHITNLARAASALS